MKRIIKILEESFKQRSNFRLLSLECVGGEVDIRQSRVWMDVYGSDLWESTFTRRDH